MKGHVPQEASQVGFLDQHAIGTLVKLNTGSLAVWGLMSGRLEIVMICYRKCTLSQLLNGCWLCLAGWHHPPHTLSHDSSGTRCTCSWQFYQLAIDGNLFTNL